MLFLVASLAALDETAGSAQAQQTAGASTDYGPLSIVPPEFIGSWRLVAQVCEPDSGEVPDTDLPHVELTLRQDNVYDLTIEGWWNTGTFTVNNYRDGPTLQLDANHRNFQLVDGNLENWSEGDAVYLCGNVFEPIVD